MKLNELFNEAEPKQVKVPDGVTVGANPAKDGPIDPSRSKGTNAGLSKKLGNVNYMWMGKQWIVDNPGAPNNGQVADRGATAQLGLPHVDELLIDIKNANVAHLVADYVLGRERDLDTDARRSSGTGRSYADIDKARGKGTQDQLAGQAGPTVSNQTAADRDRLANVRANKAINPDGNAKLAARTGNEPYQNATRDQY